MSADNLLELRHAVLKKMRAHFDDSRAVEVLSSCFQDCRSYMPNVYHLNQNAATGNNPEIKVPLAGSVKYLAPFHEFELRALCSQYQTDVYQIHPCFRNEQDDSHLYCFHMLEWARIMDEEPRQAYLVDETIDVLNRLFALNDIELEPPEAVPFDLVKFMQDVPQVPNRGYFINTDFPELEQYPSPACVDQQQQRVEFFYNGIEIANIFLDNCDAQDFHAKWPTAPASIVQLVKDAPPTVCGAIGLERLLMAMTGETDINNMLPNPLDWQ